MNSEKKVLLTILIYCAILWFTNWSLVYTDPAKHDMVMSSLGFKGLGVGLGLFTSTFLTYSIWLKIRQLLSLQATIPTSVQLGGKWRYLLFLSPLLFNYRSYTDSLGENGALLHRDFVYGSSTTIYSLLFSALAIMLFQTLVKLESFSPIEK